MPGATHHRIGVAGSTRHISKEISMKQYRQSHIGFGWLLASAVALASAGAFAADTGKVSSGGRSVNEVQGRASAASPSVGARSVSTADSPAVSEVYGRGSQMSTAPGASVGIGSLDIGDFGRGSGVLARANGKPGAANTAVAFAK
jgi:hypothetical protein